MRIEIIFGVIAAVFAIFGLCAFIKLLTETYLTPDCLSVTVVYEGDMNSDMVGCLVNCAKKKWHMNTKGRVTVLVMPDKTLPDDVIERLRDSNIEIFYATRIIK